MAITKSRIDFYNSEEGIVTLNKLKEMSKSDIYNTEAGYSANAVLYPDKLIPFVDKHMLYLKNHPSINTEHYISNLKLMTKIR
jgi:hypothetical protein